MDFQLCSVYTSVAKPAAGKLIYLGFLLFGTLLSLLVFFPGVRTFFVKHSQFCDKTLSHEKCDMLVGHILLYRVFIGMFLFFFIIAVFNCQLSIFSSYASVIENGLWFLKWNLFSFLVLVSLLIPEGEFCNTVMHAGWFTGVIMMFIQIVLIIDFAKQINLFIIGKIELSEHNSKLLYLVLSLVTSLLYTLSLGFTVYFYVVYNAKSGCHFHSMFIILVISLCVIASLLSAHPKIIDTGPLQSGIITLYVIYLAWSALSHSPNLSCSHSSAITPMDEKELYKFKLKPAMIIDGMLIFSLMFYGIYRIKNLDQFLTSLHLMNCCSLDEEEEEITAEPNESNEQAMLSSSYLSYYICVLAVILYLPMVFSDYYTPEGIIGTDRMLLETPEGIVDMSEYTRQFSELMVMSIKMTSSIMLILLYKWTIIAPLIIPQY